jgi:hypothetical protein
MNADSELDPLFGVVAEASNQMAPDSAPISPRCTDSPQSEAHTANKTLPQEHAYAVEVTPICMFQIPDLISPSRVKNHACREKEFNWFQNA